MAGDWIKMRADLFTHPKVVRIASALKADTLRTVGGLMSVWCLFDAHSEDGRLEGYTPEVLDDHLRCPGFAVAMIAVGWLEQHPAGGLVLPRFDTHNGQSAKRRAQDADRKRDDRKTSAPEADKMRTREEKRREDTSSLRSDDQSGADGLPAEFVEVWAAYPKRAGGDSRKDALKAWRARVAEGVQPAAILAGVQRYAAFCKATGKAGSEFVKQARTFFGPGEHYLEDWAAPPATGKPRVHHDLASMDYTAGVDADGRF